MKYLFDYLTFISKDLYPSEVFKLLGFDASSFSSDTRGRWGYSKRFYTDGVTVFHDSGAFERPGVMVELSGQGCRFYESHGKNDFRQLFQYLINNDLRVTRLDVACDLSDDDGDDHILSIKQIASFVRDQKYVSRARAWNVTESNYGISVSVGKRGSGFYVRFYDKAAERGFSDKYWIRTEIELRQESALGFIRGYLERESIGSMFVGVLNYNLRFVTYGKDRRSDTAEVSGWWKEFTGMALRIRVNVTPGVEYNIANVVTNVESRWANVLNVYDKTVGLDKLHKDLSYIPVPDKYAALVEDYNKFSWIRDLDNVPLIDESEIKKEDVWSNAVEIEQLSMFK